MKAAFWNAAHVDDGPHAFAANQRGKVNRIGSAMPEGRHFYHPVCVCRRYDERLEKSFRGRREWIVREAKAVSVSGSRAWNLSAEDARAAVNARSHFVEFLHSIQSDTNFIDAAELVFGELLGNVVRHAPGPVEITVDLNDDSMVLHVVDSGPPLAASKRRKLPEDVLSERGRGLFIIQQLASDVRIEHLENCGNHISVTMPRRREAAQREA